MLLMDKLLTVWVAIAAAAAFDIVVPKVVVAAPPPELDQMMMTDVSIMISVVDPELDFPTVTSFPVRGTKSATRLPANASGAAQRANAADHFIMTD